MLNSLEMSAYGQSLAALLEEVCRAGVVAWELDSGEVTCSAGLHRLLGVAPDSVMVSPAAHSSDLVHPDDRMSERVFQQHLSAGLPFTRLIRIIRPDGRMRWMSVYNEIILDALGQPKKLISVLSDVTESQEQKHKTALREERSRMAIAAMAPVVWIADAHGKVLHSSGLHALCGHADAAALGTSWLDMVHADDRERVSEGWRRSMEGGKVCEADYRLVCADGTLLKVRALGTPVLQDGGVLEWNVLLVRLGKATAADAGRPCLTGAQIRAARAILKWSLNDLARSADIGVAVLRRLEDMEKIPPKDEKIAQTIAAAITWAGVDLVFDSEGRPGVRPALDRLKSKPESRARVQHTQPNEIPSSCNPALHLPLGRFSSYVGAAANQDQARVPKYARAAR